MNDVSETFLTFCGPRQGLLTWPSSFLFVSSFLCIFLFFLFFAYRFLVLAFQVELVGRAFLTQLVGRPTWLVRGWVPSRGLKYHTSVIPFMARHRNLFIIIVVAVVVVVLFCYICVCARASVCVHAWVLVRLLKFGSLHFCSLKQPDSFSIHQRY